MGVAAIFFVPSGRVWGKRHAFVIGLVIVFASSLWAGAVRTEFDTTLGEAEREEQAHHSYRVFLASRIVQGIGCAPYETLVNAAVGDLYFVHQRGLRMAFTNLAVFGGAFLTPVVAGRITRDIGFSWTFYIVAILLGTCLPAVFFLCPEMAFVRDASLNTDMITNDHGPQEPNDSSGTDLRTSGLAEKPLTLDGGHASLDEMGAMPSASPRNLEHSQATNIPPRKTFLQSLALFDGRKTNESYWKLLLRPFPLFIQPAFLWACLIQGTMIGWTVMIGVIMAKVYMGPPYFFDEVKTGNTYWGAFIGAIVGFVISGLLSDFSAKFLTKRNKGVYEPEFRIVMILPMLIFGCAGIYGFGITAANVESGGNLYGPIVFFGFQVGGMVVGAVASSLYIVDAYRTLFRTPFPKPSLYLLSLYLLSQEPSTKGGYMPTDNS